MQAVGNVGINQNRIGTLQLHKWDNSANDENAEYFFLYCCLNIWSGHAGDDGNAQLCMKTNSLQRLPFTRCGM